jgi:predicted TIM-barrel fold metal-dependent hydrolase
MTLGRREFLTVSAAAFVRLGLPPVEAVGLRQGSGQRADASAEAIIDIHQHVGYNGRADEALLAHQRTMGATTTILLPAGRPVNTASTHDGLSNGLQAKCLGNDACAAFAKAHPTEFLFAANDVPDIDGAIQEIERYLALGGVAVAEQKFGVECDSPAMQKIYALAQSARVPVLMHWQYNMYNYGFDRFYKMLEKYPRVNFVGHAQTWWGNVDRNFRDQNVMYPVGPVTPGGLTDRYLSDYPNMYGDLSAGSGLNALTRDEAHAREFIVRHQDRLIFGSDCNDLDGAGATCQGAQIIGAVRRLASSKVIERKLLHDNAKKLFRL